MTNLTPDNPATENPPPDTHHMLQAYLASVDAPCPGCGYNLRGTTTTRCPECGSPIALGIVSPNARRAPWFLATLALSLTLIVDWVAMLMVLVPGFLLGTPNMGGTPLYWKALLALFLLGFSAGIGLFFTLRTRDWWQSRPVPVQWARTALIFLAVFIVHALGSVWILTI